MSKQSQSRRRGVRTKLIGFWATTSEHEQIKADAVHHGTTVSGLIRQRLNLSEEPK